MNKLQLLVVCFLALVAGLAAAESSIQSLVGREFRIQDDWAGQELAFRKKSESICVVWRILGSGRPILSEIEIPVEAKSPRQCVFDVQLRDGVLK